MTDQLSLFNTEAGATALTGAPPRFQAGDLVIQTWPWIGMYGNAYPYWQVHSWATRTHRDGSTHIEYLCHAIPYGAHPIEVWWFKNRDLDGLSRRLPIPETVDGAYQRNEWGRCGLAWRADEGQRMYGHPRRLADGLPLDDPATWSVRYWDNLQKLPAFHDDRDGAPVYRTVSHPTLAPYEWERDLCYFLDSLPVPWYGCSRDNYDEMLAPFDHGPISIAAAWTPSLP